MSPDLTADASGPPGAIEPTARRRSWPGRAASLLGRLCGPDADDALPNRYRLQVRAGLLDETL
ncbi:hypothetical protein INQ30_29520, partial [Escherichia coli]|nr:hypothetical protein [Escherichia coli]